MMSAYNNDNITDIKKDRIHIVDAVRGLSVILMVFYHFGFDAVSFLGMPANILFNPVMIFLEMFFAGVFIFLSGTSCRFSRSNLRRGAMVFGLAVLITLLTYFMMPDFVIWFGILHFLGASMLIYGFLGKYLNKISPLLLLLLYTALYIITYIWTDSFGYTQNPYIFWLGFTTVSFFTADFFPLLPWIFVFLTGTLFGKLVIDRKLPEWFYRFKSPALEFFGRHALLIYLIHQPVMIGIIYLIRMITKF